MPQAVQNAYLESRVSSAEPIDLVRLLYQAASGAVRDARHHLAAGDIIERARAISKAYAIVAELARSLDKQRGGALATRLAQLYDYIERRLLEANSRQEDKPLAEVLALLATLGEAWDGAAAQLKPAERPAVGPSMTWGQATEAETTGHAWSL